MYTIDAYFYECSIGLCTGASKGGRRISGLKSTSQTILKLIRCIQNPMCKDKIWCLNTKENKSIGFLPIICYNAGVFYNASWNENKLKNLRPIGPYAISTAFSPFLHVFSETFKYINAKIIMVFSAIHYADFYVSRIY